MDVKPLDNVPFNSQSKTCSLLRAVPKTLTPSSPSPSASRGAALTLLTTCSVLMLLYWSNCCCVMGGSTALAGRAGWLGRLGRAALLISELVMLAILCRGLAEVAGSSAELGASGREPAPGRNRPPAGRPGRDGGLAGPPPGAGRGRSGQRGKGDHGTAGNNRQNKVSLAHHNHVRDRTNTGEKSHVMLDISPSCDWSLDN